MLRKYKNDRDKKKTEKDKTDEIIYYSDIHFIAGIFKQISDNLFHFIDVDHYIVLYQCQP